MSTNGQELVASRLARVQAASMAWEEREQELEQLRTELAELAVRHKGLEAEHGALQVAYQRMMTEIDLYREERDKAVARRAELEVVLDTLLTVMNRFQAPPVPREEEGHPDEGLPH